MKDLGTEIMSIAGVHSSFWARCSWSNLYCEEKGMIIYRIQLAHDCNGL